MIVHSPIHSFVDFEDRLYMFTLPVVDFYVPQFQFLFENGAVDWDDVLKVQLVTTDRSTVLVEMGTEVGVISNMCSWCTISDIYLNSADYPVTVSANNVIPAGTYASAKDITNAFKLQGLNPEAGIFLYCCDYGDSNHYDIFTSIGNITVDFQKGLQYVSFVTDPDQPDLFSPVAMHTCFRYRIYNETRNEWVDSNVFVRKPDTRHLMVAEYSSNEDSYDFKYPVGVQNVVYLPILLRNPKYPEKRKVYKKSNQHYKVLSASIEKEYDLITDYLPDAIHDRIVVMLAHDNLFFTADNISSLVSKREGDDYSPEWPEDVNWLNNEPVAQGKGKISVPFEGRNSNCEKRPVCAFTIIPLPECHAVVIPAVTLPDATAGIFYNESIAITGTTPFTLSNVTKPVWMTIAIGSDAIRLYGTPTSLATAVAVSFTLTNCNATPAVFSDTIDVVANTGGGTGGGGTGGQGRYSINEPANNRGGKIAATLVIDGVDIDTFILTPDSPAKNGIYHSTSINTSVMLRVRYSSVIIDTIQMFITGIAGERNPGISETGGENSATYTWDQLNLSDNPNFDIYINIVS